MVRALVKSKNNDLMAPRFLTPFLPMPILFIFLSLAFVYPVLLLLDMRTRAVAEANSNETNYKSDPYLSDSLVLFSPFITLFYHEHFWSALLCYFFPFYAYCLVVTYGVSCWKKSGAYLQMLVLNGGGSVLLTLIGYYLFFHTGALVEDTVVTSDSEGKPWWIWWPFILIALSGALTAALNSEKLLWVLGIGLLIVPFFSHHPLWAMGMASLVFMLVCFSLAQQQGNSAYVALLMFYMMAQMAALIIYAVLF